VLQKLGINSSQNEVEEMILFEAIRYLSSMNLDLQKVHGLQLDQPIHVESWL
jgi:hypothetical protein